MSKKILIIILMITIIVSTQSYVLAKYILIQDIQIAEVDVKKPVKRKKYTIEIYYKDISDNQSMKMSGERIYEGDEYKFEILEFEGYTYLYTVGELTGIVEKNTKIYCYYEKNK